jgi:glutamine amidotransferase
MVAIIDYGMGNVASVQKALNFLKIDSVVTNNHKLISESDCIILPGVGSFMQGMMNLEEKGLDVLLTHEVLERKKKFLGICLGMQLIIEQGTEPLDYKGLGWIKGSVKKIDTEGLRVPHMGWNNISVINNAYYRGIDDLDFYFIHSYHMVPEDKQVVAATVNYGIDLVASIQSENIFATQFHPEKSQVAGLTLLRNFFEINA